MMRDAVESLLNHLNDVRPTIKFIMELEDGSLPFLDARLTQRDGGSLDVTVYRKPTHTDRYLHFNSHHPLSAKRAAVRSLFDRARNVTLRKENMQEEPHHYFQTERLSLALNLCHLLSHRGTIRHQRRRNQKTKDPRTKRRNSH